MMPAADLIVYNSSQLLTMASDGMPKAGNAMSDLRIIKNGAIAACKGKIIWVGRLPQLSKNILVEENALRINAEGAVVMPGFVDPHTHLVFAGTREDEFSQKIAGATYMEIAAAGGGIKRSVRTTREATQYSLFLSAQKRLREALAFGTTCIEIKSGYGLSTDSELKILTVATQLKAENLTEIARTFLGAHDVPPEKDRSSYIKLVCDDMIPKVVSMKLAEFCDVFCEKNVFTVAESKYILSVALAHGLKPKIHADQMSCIGASTLAGEINAISADHLDYIDDAGIQSLKSGRTIPVLLPGAVFFLGLKQYPPARKMIAANLPVALATDFNPGSCMTLNFPMIMTIASTQCRMTIPETLSASTINAAFSIGKESACGSLEVGKRADILILDTPNYEMISYHFGHNHVRHVICNGKWAIRDFQYVLADEPPQPSA